MASTLTEVKFAPNLGAGCGVAHAVPAHVMIERADAEPEVMVTFDVPGGIWAARMVASMIGHAVAQLEQIQIGGNTRYLYVHVDMRG